MGRKHLSITQKACLVGLLHVLMVVGLGAKLLVDRAHCPRRWVRVLAVDPSLPIRGRYVQLRVMLPLQVPPKATLPPPRPPSAWEKEKGLRPAPDPFHVKVAPMEKGMEAVWVPGRDADNRYVYESHWPDQVRARSVEDPLLCNGVPHAVLEDTVVFFIPEHVADPSRLSPGETLWAEVTLPRKGPLRPIRLAVIRPGGAFERLPF